MMDDERTDNLETGQQPDPDELASLRDELTQMRSDLLAARDELSKVKQLNYTLARQLDVSARKTPTIEQQLNDLFGVRGGGS